MCYFRRTVRKIAVSLEEFECSFPVINVEMEAEKSSEALLEGIIRNIYSAKNLFLPVLGQNSVSL
ncbi:hypothetical protein AKJ38_00180 [candidate division MSBL1 archaeon SCGC-AAA259I14]|uniref:Uncharacterized protein n=1 Tax=candidate division MSBL1 archaeon SCGC-AAA259I14 TaxID=1698268 RepID=A0A133UUE7_9EURY|nr:hypothetical protein AKJ38_00180 [candidate division MSBL1 archaeon SCGC-AAA259I14]